MGLSDWIENSDSAKEVELTSSGDQGYHWLEREESMIAGGESRKDVQLHTFHQRTPSLNLGLVVISLAAFYYPIYLISLTSYTHSFAKTLCTRTMSWPPSRLMLLPGLASGRDTWAMIQGGRRSVLHLKT
jgi:hypothetical protein